jgi:glutamate/tyrosine decarboxylase-like PLP-dependent enzyme
MKESHVNSLPGGPTGAAIGQAMLRVMDQAFQPANPAAVQLADAGTLAHLRGLGVPRQGRPLDEVVDEMLTHVYPHRARMDHKRFFAFIPSPASTLSQLGDVMTSLHNPHTGSWLQSSGPSCVEDELVRWLAGQLGMPDGAGGLTVSGGSMANLTALTVARDRMLRPDERALGVAYVSEQTHSSVAKGLKIIGLLPGQIRRVACDDRFRLDVPALEAAIAEDRAAGRVPFAVVASAGTTNTGSVDPLPAIRALCTREGLWMHVDGAYGASMVLAPSCRHLLEGIGEADSVSWDAHKWLFQTYGCGLVFLRDRRHLQDAFHTRPEYLRDAEVNGREVNFWDLGMELTRPARGLKLWLTLQVMGSRAMGEAIEHGCRLAEWAQDELARRTDWEIVSPAQSAIVNFRKAPAGLDAAGLDKLNRAISQRALDDGHAAVLTTRLRGQTVLRICAIHPGATEQDMRSTIHALDGFAAAELAG